MQTIILEGGDKPCGPAPDRSFTADQVLDVRDIANSVARWLTLPRLRDRAVVLLIATAVADGRIERRETWVRIVETLAHEAHGKKHSLGVARLERATAIEIAVMREPTQMAEIYDRDYPRELLGGGTNGQERAMVSRNTTNVGRAC